MEKRKKQAKTSLVPKVDKSEMLRNRWKRCGNSLLIRHHLERTVYWIYLQCPFKGTDWENISHAINGE